MALNDPFGTVGSELQPSTRTTYNPNNALQGVISQFQTAANQARAANEARKQQILGLYGQMESMYAPGGTFGQSYLSDLAVQKAKDVGSAMQGDISRGLFGLTNRASEWESTVGAPARLKLEDMRTQALSNILTGQAGFLERIEEPYPDFQTMAQLVMQASR